MIERADPASSPTVAAHPVSPYLDAEPAMGHPGSSFREVRHLKVLVTVKATPQPSASYGDTVCVAGIEVQDDKPVGWIRLYPVPFRYLEGDQKFGKYQLIDVAVSRNRKDARPESFRIDASSLQLGPTIAGWPKRVPYVEPLVTDSMCAVLDAVRRDVNGPSLALVRPTDVLGLRMERHPGWTPKQQTVLDQWANQLDLFGSAGARKVIEPPRFSAKYRYRCAALACKGHEQGILDWELTALQRRLASQSDEAVRDAITKNFLDVVGGSGRAPAFFVGNQADPTKRQTFSVLGAYYPKAADAAALPLF